MDIKKVCKYCKYYTHGACYYNPPTCMVVDFQWMAVHPPVLEDERCSKWQLNSKYKNQEK